MSASKPSSPLQPTSMRRRMVRLCVPMLAVLFLGTAGFMWTDGWTFERSLYFTIITFTTVGYGDYDLSVAGQRFAAVVILVGFATFTYVLGQLVQIIVERQLDWERVMERRAKTLQDHFIIVGYGRIGQIVCKRLHEESIPFVVVDNDRHLVEAAARAGFIAIAANATHDEILQDCQINRARGIACLTTSDANNIVITLSARAIRPDLTIISRAESEDHVRKLKHAGATRVISPVQSGAVAVSNIILRPQAVDFLDDSADSTRDLEFSRLTVTPGSTLDGNSLAATQICPTDSLVVVAIRRAEGSTEINPSPNTHLVAGDSLIIAGQPGAVLEFCADAA